MRGNVPDQAFDRVNLVLKLPVIQSWFIAAK